MLRFRRAFTALALLSIAAASFLTGRSPLAPAGVPPLGEWTYLSDFSWERASTEWMMVGNEGLPSIDSTFFTGAPLAFKGRIFSKGLGTYAPSEIVYRLDNLYSNFEAIIGVEADDRPGKAAARFLVFLDGTKAFESPAMNSEDALLTIRLPVRGIDEMRLVTVRSEDSLRGAHVFWADARLRQNLLGNRAPLDGFVRQMKAAQAARAEQRLAQQSELASKAREEIDSLRLGLGGDLPGPQEPPQAAWNVPASAISLANNRLGVIFGLGGARHGTLTLLDLVGQRFVAYDVVSSIDLGSGETIDFHRDTQPPDAKSYASSAVSHPVLGSGTRLQVRLMVPNRSALIDVEFTLFTDSAVLLYRMEVDQAHADPKDLRFKYIDAASPGGVYVGEQVNYLADFVRLRHVLAGDDGLLRREHAAWGKPIYLWSQRDGQGALIAVVEETPLPPLFSFQLDPGRVAAQVGFSAPAASPVASKPGPVASGLLYLEVTAGASLQETFGRYRALLTHLAPPPALPPWVKHQWLSWYVHYMDITEEALVRQIDLMAEHFGDLGPWHILVDAGWYVAEGRPGAEWRTQDLAKFPRGLRWLVDYAHSRGIYVVLYFSAPYLNARQSEGDWLGLRSIIEDHPEWIIPLDDGPPKENFVYNFQHPGLRAYVAEVMRDYFQRYDVDGIKLDGLGSSGDSVLYSAEGGPFGLSDRALAQTMAVYRFVHEQATHYKEDVYIESGWLAPLLANSYSHTFRYGDEEPTFSRLYPLAGFIEHIDYAAYQQAVLGQRSNMGAVYGDPNESAVNRWWLEAGLALGTQVALSFDLGVLLPETISQYRALLAPYRPFEGTTIIDRALEQSVFSTVVEDTRYVGVLNRAKGSRRVTVPASALGLERGDRFVGFDVETGGFLAGEGPLALDMEAESFRLLVVRTQPGMLWANSRILASPAGASTFQIHAPPTVDGFLYLFTPKPKALYWDDQALLPSGSPFQETLGYDYDEATSVLTLWYPARGVHTLFIE